MNSEAYVLGQLTAFLEKEKALAGYNPVGKIMDNPALVLKPAIEKIMRAGRADLITEYMSQLSPETLRTSPLVEDEVNNFTLGYYHERVRLKGGTVQADIQESLTERYEIKFTPTMKAWVLANGGAETIRRLIQQEMNKDEMS